jgi:hypothetical protein
MTSDVPEFLLADFVIGADDGAGFDDPTLPF